MKILNLYAGLGGNRKLWKNVDVTAVENNDKIAEQYKKFYPNDDVIVDDAHSYLINNYEQYDFIWSSPPCQSHSRMVKATRHKVRKYPDLKIYEEIIFLQNFCKSYWIVENVVPYYEPLIKPIHKIGRHLFWSNFKFKADEVKSPHNFIKLSNKEQLQNLKDWLGIQYDKNIYYENNHDPAQVLRNCVHPIVGKQILDCVINYKYNKEDK
jgi:DNA (cytosine-5)-methyltransferase 1